MSADNGIIVRSLSDGWWVAYGFASDESWGSIEFMRKGARYATRGEALVAAHDLEHKYGYLEYGVTEVP